MAPPAGAKLGVPAIAIALAAVLLAPPPSSRAGPPPTGGNQLQFFNISLRLVRVSTYERTGMDWRAGFSRMAQYAQLADIITVLEAPYTRRAEILGVIEARLGADYSILHSDARIRVCSDRNLPERRRTNECGNTMIAYRTGRIVAGCEGCAVRRWVPYNEQKGQSCAQRGNATHIMARLRDTEANKIVTVVPVHFDPGLSLDCLALNVTKLNDLLEGRLPWRNRPLTVVIGDFNEHPDDPSNGTQIAWRQEQDKSCWYRRFSLHAGDDACDAETWGDRTFPYIDTVGLKHVTGTADICDQWTLGNNFPVARDERERADRCDSEVSSSKKRIDYLWVRYETSDGMAITEPNPQWADQQVAAAGTDQGYFDSTPESPYGGGEVIYSDHRMIHALLYWCSPDAESSGYPTPCT